MAFTFFFRDVHTLEAVADYVHSYLSIRSHVRVWDAGCATGAEPFTLAIILRERMGSTAFGKVSIEATDLDPQDQFSELIRTGVYPEEYVRRIPSEIRDAYFAPNGKADQVALSSTVKDRVSFQKHDLLSLQPIRKGFQVIVCKNVLLHFRQDQRIQVIRMFHDCLSDGGIFATEHTQEMPEELSGLFERVVSNVRLFRKAG